MRRHVDEVAALHLALLAEIDPVGVFEYIAALPSDQFIWPAATWLQASDLAPNLETVVAGASTHHAVLLALACSLDAVCDDAIVRLSEVGREEKARSDEIESAWRQEIKDLFRRLAKSVVERPDAASVLEPWLYHLVRSCDRTVFSENDYLPTIARMGVEEVVGTSRAAAAKLSDEHDAVALTVRMLLADSPQECEDAWRAWHQRVAGGDPSLKDCRDNAWMVAGDTLARTERPLETWILLTVAYERWSRRRTRMIEYETRDLSMCVAMPALHAAARLGYNGKALWQAAFVFARRDFLVDRPHSTDRSYMLPALTFAAFHRVLGDDKTELAQACELLPTAAHLECARELLAVNPVRSEAGQMPNSSFVRSARVSSLLASLS
jgi:hypothetical protein